MIAAIDCDAIAADMRARQDEARQIPRAVTTIDRVSAENPPLVAPDHASAPGTRQKLLVARRCAA
jgi:hypothetical protein